MKKSIMVFFTVVALSVVMAISIYAEETKSTVAGVTYNATYSGQTQVYTLESVDYTNYYSFYLNNENIWDNYSFSIFNSSGNKVGSVYCYEGRSASYNIKMVPGENYYVTIYSTSRGDYSFTYNIYEDVSDKMSTAKVVNIGAEVQENICVGGSDDDWYKLESVDYTNYYTVEAKNISFGKYLYFQLFDSEGNAIDRWDFYAPGSEGEFRFKTEPNEDYYLKVYGSADTKGNYSFSYNVTKDAADNRVDAETVKAEDTVEETICIGGKDVDWYKLEQVCYPNYYSFSVNNKTLTGSMYVEVIDSTGTTVYKQVISKANKLEFKLKLSPNEDYYLKLYDSYNYSGKYSFVYSVSEDVADNSKTAKSISSGVEITENICVSGDEDWYCFTATIPEVKIVFTNIDSLNINMYVYDENGDTELKRVNVYSKNNSGTIIFKDASVLKAGQKYKIKVTSSNLGRYSFVVGDIYASDLLMNIPGTHYSWKTVGSYAFWYEGGVRQGTYEDAKGVMGDGTIRGREIADLGKWYWLDSCRSGAKATDKEVWIPYIYQGDKNWNEETRARESKASIMEKGQALDGGETAGASYDMSAQVAKAIKEEEGKWVRYDADGQMMKGWVKIEGELAEIYPNQKGNVYFYDYKTGLMAKGTLVIDGVEHYFNEVTGVMER